MQTHPRKGQTPMMNLSMATTMAKFAKSNKFKPQTIISSHLLPTSHNINNNQQDTEQWVKLCRTMLIDMESKNIKTRAIFWTKFVNDTTTKTMMKLNNILPSSSINSININDYIKFEFNVNEPLKHLRFLAEWTGLKTQQMQYMPKSYTEFEYKAKNWLNGRKAPNYALTLFPAMIHEAEAYAEQHSHRIFPNNKDATNLLSTALRFGYLSKLCSAKISLNDTGRKTPLLIENSIKTAKSTTSKIFQQYAIDHPYSNQFPTHTSEAAQYFERKFTECLNRLLGFIQSGGNMNIMNNNLCNMNGSMNIMPTMNIPPLPNVIPPLSDGGTVNTSTHSASASTSMNINDNNIKMNINQMVTVTDLNNNNNVTTPNSTTSNGSNSTFASRQFGTSSGANGNNMVSPSSSASFNGTNNNHIILTSDKYNSLCQTLDRLTHTQQAQKDTIHQLITRLQSLERVIDAQKNVINQFPLQFRSNGIMQAPPQIIQQQQQQHQQQQDFYNQHHNNNVNPTPSISSLQQNTGYSLVPDFQNASSTNTSTPTITTNSSTHSTNSTNTPPLHNYYHQQPQQPHTDQNDGDVDITDNNNDNDSDDDDISQNVDNNNRIANNSTFAPMFDGPPINNNDIQMFSNMNQMGFPGYI